MRKKHQGGLDVSENALERFTEDIIKFLSGNEG